MASSSSSSSRPLAGSSSAAGSAHANAPSQGWNSPVTPREALLGALLFSGLGVLAGSLFSGSSVRARASASSRGAAAAAKQPQQQQSGSASRRPLSVVRAAPISVQRAPMSPEQMLSPTEPGASDTEASFSRLTAENARLRRLVELSERMVGAPGSSGAPEGISASDIERLHVLFNTFDTNSDGRVSIDQLAAVMKRVGEPLTEDEARDAFAELDFDQSGYFSFGQFLRWWRLSHSSEGKSKYHEKFKMVSASLEPANFDAVNVSTQSTGKDLEFRVHFFYKQPGGALKQISPWHDIPLLAFGGENAARPGEKQAKGKRGRRPSLDLAAQASGGKGGRLFHFVCEIPRWTRSKFEIATGEVLNPIKQDVKNGKLRFYKYGDMMFNYGAFPQTWEDPAVTPQATGYPGDNDPLDVIEVGSRQLQVGQVVKVKVLGVLALIDSNETDWKVLAININDPLAHQLQDVDDLERELPGAIQAIREYLRSYKVWHGIEPNKYAFQEQAMPRDFAVEVVDRCHEHWRAMTSREV